MERGVDEAEPDDLPLLLPLPEVPTASPYQQHGDYHFGNFVSSADVGNGDNEGSFDQMVTDADNSVGEAASGYVSQRGRLAYRSMPPWHILQQ